jgi:outer membrane protein assembly factor BamB
MEFGFFKKHNALASLSSVDGSVRWSTPIPDGTLQSPAHSDRHSLILTGTSTGTLYALRTKDGKIIWKTNPASLPIQIVAAPCICEETSTVIVTGLARNETEQSGIFAFNIRDGSLRWQNTELQYGSYGTPVVFNNLVLVTGLDKSLRALDLVSGKTIWKTDFKSRVFSTPACGTIRETAYIYLGTNDSVLYEINPATGDVEGASMFTERITNQVVLDEENHAIYVPTYANEIYALKPKSI